MFIGKWNKSVILTYVGLAFSIIGIYLSIHGQIKYALSCLIVVGICDLFDGTVARMCKRTDEEKRFGIELDSLADVVDFLAFPIVLFISIGLNKWYYLFLYITYAICGVARLAYFNITLETKNKDKAVKYYHGLPVTYAALIIPLLYLVTYLIPSSIHNIYLALVMLTVSILFILNVNIKKPTLKVYPFFVILAIIVLVLYLGVL